MGFPEAHLSLTLVGDTQMAEIAGRYGREPRPTDVLAFATAEGPGAEHRGECVGDVLISIETAEAQANARGVELERELETLLVHGVLHLLGMDHMRKPQARAMHELESHLLWELSRAL